MNAPKQLSWLPDLPPVAKIETDIVVFCVAMAASTRSLHVISFSEASCSFLASCCSLSGVLLSGLLCSVEMSLGLQAGQARVQQCSGDALQGFSMRPVSLARMMAVPFDLPRECCVALSKLVKQMDFVVHCSSDYPRLLDPS